MVAIYARQSILKPDSLSIEQQIEACKKHLNENESFTIYKDSGYSGKNTHRPDYERMVDNIKNGLISKVIVYRLDRITRSVLDFYDMKKTFDDNEVSFVSISEQFDTSSVMGNAMLTILVAFAQMERENIISRVRDNYKQRAEQGFYTSGPAPYGFQLAQTTLNGKKTSMLSPVETEIAIVKKLFDMYAYDEMTSLNKLSLWLNDQEIWTRKQKPWVSSTVANILLNPIYVKADADIYTYLHDVKGATINDDVSNYIGVNGCYVYKPGTSDKKRTKLNYLENACVTLALHEGIIDSHTWLKCQKRMSKNTSFKRNGQGSHSWLSGIMKCAYCGFAIIAVHHKDIDRTYINCGGKKRKVCEGRKRSIQVIEIENIVTPLLLERIRYIRDIELKEIRQDSRRVNEAKIEIVKIDKRIKNLIESLAEMSGAAFKMVSQALNEENEKREKLVKELEDALIEQQQQDHSAIDFDDCLNNWDSYDIEKKKNIARIFIKAVFVSDDEIIPVFK